MTGVHTVSPLQIVPAPDKSLLSHAISMHNLEALLHVYPLPWWIAAY